RPLSAARLPRGKPVRRPSARVAGGVGGRVSSASTPTTWIPAGAVWVVTSAYLRQIDAVLRRSCRRLARSGGPTESGSAGGLGQEGLALDHHAGHPAGGHQAAAVVHRDGEGEPPALDL